MLLLRCLAVRKYFSLTVTPPPALHTPTYCQPRPSAGAAVCPAGSL